MMGHMPDRDIARAGSYVAARRGDLGMSQEDLAKAADVDVKTVRDFELGKRWPWSKTRSAIARALQMSTLDLQAAGEPEPTAAAGLREERLTPLDEFERRVVSADLPEAEKAAAIRRHRDQARQMLDELGISEPPELLRRAVRRYAGETEAASDAERRGA